jgi:hypothetical protein
MKIIISHDVDHLYNTDHLKDLILTKLWIRSSLDLFRGRITTQEWSLRLLSIFKKKMNRIDEIMQFDIEHGVPSTFFFGMASGLGMSYSKSKALPCIRHVRGQGFDTGVHGIAYEDMDLIQREYDDFKELMHIDKFGIRMHYVRYDDDTFGKLAQAGYLFDSSEFDKKQGYMVKNPYKINGMWEFPLGLMDSYLPYRLVDAKRITLEVLEKAANEQLDYLTVLFHDPYFDDAYSIYKQWYIWLIETLATWNFEFVSFRKAIDELNKE